MPHVSFPADVKGNSSPNKSEPKSEPSNGGVPNPAALMELALEQNFGKDEASDEVTEAEFNRIMKARREGTKPDTESSSEKSEKSESIWE